MSPALAAFGGTYIINLPDRADRRREMIEQLRIIGCRPGQGIEFHPAARPADPGGFRTIGARGCFLSHLGVLQKAMNAGLDSVLILEDDANFVADMAARMPRIAAFLHAQPWDCFYGGCGVDEQTELGTGRLSPIAPDILSASPELPIGLTHCVAFHGAAIADAHAYLSAMLGRPPGHADGGPMDVDGAYSWFRRERRALTLLASPQIAHQRASRSSVSTPRWFDRVPVLAQGMGLARSVKNRLRSNQH